MASGSSARRSSSRLAKVGHMMARSSCNSFIRSSRSAGLKNAGGDSMYFGGSALFCLRSSSVAR
ncbi:hypothetical protein HJ590_01125 [Naumannella sp. ID2617S]|nr:hypothetical protein [Naumannella sp. ID2617S]